MEDRMTLEHIYNGFKEHMKNKNWPCPSYHEIKEWEEWTEKVLEELEKKRNIYRDYGEIE